MGAEGEDPAGAHHALMLPFPEGMDPQIEGLCRRCWALQPCHRPTMPQFMTSLRAIGAAHLGQGAALLFPGLRYLQVGFMGWGLHALGGWVGGAV